MEAICRRGNEVTTIACACDEIIVKSENGVAKIRAKILVVRDNKVFAVCKSCNTEVQVPLVPAAIKLELPATAAGPPLILSK